MANLYVVPTPIGNLDDMTFRAVQILKDVDLILAEDTRTSAKLLSHYSITTPMRSYHMHNEHKTTIKWVEAMQNGQILAIISDAGTPAISDPGFLLVRECIHQHIDIECLPGATAFVPALVQSGLPCNQFTFEGFLPHKKGRKTKLMNLSEEQKTMIFYESPYRIIKTLEQFVDCFGSKRPISISREISKKFEQTLRGTIDDMITYFKTNEPKGEFVIVVQGKSK